MLCCQSISHCSLGLSYKDFTFDFHLDGVQIEQVHEFKHLGLLVQEKEVASITKVHSRIDRATVAIASLKGCLWKVNMSIKTKSCLFRTQILPILP